ncbi:hypothetical protein [Tanticharoenia sakaeratensis]|uniref:hypothetical protein n=1 Tax=Tanticharoenia sakaeratensis TaxID=444053 RepID=UPI0011DDC074|nr:hypothetical protein [Tanticharoenia sakaeratensis]
MSDIDALSAPDLSNEADERLKAFEKNRLLLEALVNAAKAMRDAVQHEDKYQALRDFTLLEQSFDPVNDSIDVMEADLAALKVEEARIWEWDAERARAGVR